MTKGKFRLTVYMVPVFMSMALTACGGKEEAAGQGTTAAQAQVTEAQVSQESAEPEKEKYSTVADFVNSETMQKQLEAQTQSMGDANLDISVAGEDNKLIYTFAYRELKSAEGMAEVLQETQDAESATLVQLANYIKEAVDVENPVVVVRYLDTKGNEIYSAEFVAE